MQPVHITLTLVGLLGASSAWAADCTNASDQASLNQCTSGDYASQDKRLNQVYGDYRARLAPQQKQQLKAAQLAWIKFRDLSCAFESSGVQGGSAYSMVLSGCLAAKTTTRIDELQRLADCPEGDLSCPALAPLSRAGSGR